MTAPFFIVASARSGTTFVRLTLNAHPDVAVPPESRFVTELYDSSGEVAVEDLLARLATHERFQTWELPIERVAAELEGAGERVAYPDAIRAAYRAYAAAHGKTIWGDKTPRYIEHIPLVASLFPDARFIHIVRDGRNVALSYSHVNFGPKNVARAAELWKRRVARGRADGRALGADRYIELRNEDLAADTESEVRKACGFLGIDFHPAMLDESERRKGVVAKTTHHFDPEASGRSRMSDWRHDMKPRDIETFESIAGDLLAELGYERCYPSPGRVAQTRAKLGLVGFPLGRL